MRPEGELESQPDVLVLRTMGAARASGKLRRGRARAREADPSPTPLPLTRATVIRGCPFDDEPTAVAWLERVTGERELFEGAASE